MKILELTNFSSGICGVWTRVKQESLELSKKGHDVRIFSSNATKGSSEIAACDDSLGKIKIKRFSFKKLGGESFMSWKFEEEAIKFNPDIMIVHGYRHLHTTRALKLAKKLNCKIFLVTHAPFIESNSTRSFLSKLTVNFYDKFIGPKKINQFDKVIAITNWEIPYLMKLGCNKEKITYIPNGIPEEFFKEKILLFKSKKIIFLGRISPIKGLETLIKAASLIPQMQIEIIGPSEGNYGADLKSISPKNVKFIRPIYDLKLKIKKLQEADIFVLPSNREAMPQSLIEALSLGKIVISSSTQGGKEIITNKKTGFLFEIGNEHDLAEKINFCLSKENSEIIKQIQINSRKKSEEFRWSKLIEKLESLFS